MHARQGTFYLIASIEGSTLGSAEFRHRLLDEYGVSTVPGIGYGESCDEYIRLSVGLGESMERIRHGIEQIAESMDESVVSFTGRGRDLRLAEALAAA